MAKDNVRYMADKKHDGTLWSSEDALKDALKQIQSGQRDAKDKVLVLFLNDRDGAYDVSFVQAGLRTSGCVTICEVAKSMFKRDMGY